MRVRSCIPIALLLLAAPARAQLNTYYEGTQVVDGKNVPVALQFSVDKGRVATVFKGARSTRMIYLRKENLLRVIDDETKSYIDLANGDRNAMADMQAQMQKQLEGMPPEQRAMAEQMMGHGMPGAPAPVANVYVRSDAHQAVKGYDCTRVDIMRGDVKRAEYWGTTSKDFQMTEDERQTRIAMQEAMSALLPMARDAGGETRPFEWDTKVEGYPLISRCFEGDVATLDVHLTAFDRKPLDAALFEVPKGYAKREMDADGARDRHHRHPETMRIGR